jgi:hypothetical protein
LNQPGIKLIATFAVAWMSGSFNGLVERSKPFIGRDRSLSVLNLGKFSIICLDLPMNIGQRESKSEKI